MSRFMDWLRFHGWRNLYWREDAWMARCPHDGPVWSDQDGWTLCVNCGRDLGYTLATTTGTGNVTTHLKIRTWMRS